MTSGIFRGVEPKLAETLRALPLTGGAHMRLRWLLAMPCARRWGSAD